MSYAEFILHVALFVLFGYLIYFSFQLTKKLYGGRFTAVLPPLIGAISILLSIQVIEAVFEFVPLMSHEAESFITFITQVLLIVSGVLFVEVIYSLYKIGFATSGFFGGK